MLIITAKTIIKQLIIPKKTESESNFVNFKLLNPFCMFS